MARSTQDVDSRLPRFTEEREAAAILFVKKNLPDLLPMLEQLKKANESQYKREIRQIFQASEWLADLKEVKGRYELELRIWKAENKAHTLAAKLSTCAKTERESLERGLQELAKELVDLDIQVLEFKADQLYRELSEVRDELGKAKVNAEKNAKERYDQMYEKAKKYKK